MCVCAFTSSFELYIWLIHKGDTTLGAGPAIWRVYILHRSLLPRSVEKRPMRLRLENGITWPLFKRKKDFGLHLLVQKKETSNLFSKTLFSLFEVSEEGNDFTISLSFQEEREFKSPPKVSFFISKSPHKISFFFFRSPLKVFFFFKSLSNAQYLLEKALYLFDIYIYKYTSPTSVQKSPVFLHKICALLLSKFSFLFFVVSFWRRKRLFFGTDAPERRCDWVFCRDTGLFCRDIGLFCSDTGLFVETDAREETSRKMQLGLLQRYRALLQRYRALLQIYRALLQRYRALL